MNIPKRANKCEKGGELFEKGTSYISHIIETEKGLERKDYCQKCSGVAERQSRSYSWQGKIPEANEKEPIDEKSFRLLKSLLKKSESTDLLTLLVLSLLRKKQLIEIDADHYESAYTGEVFHVKTCFLDPKNTEALLGKMRTLLNEPCR